MLKESYFTQENIDKKAQEMLKKLKILPKCNIDLEPAALLIIDMQRFFLDENSHAFIPSAKAIIPKIQSLQKGFSAKNLPIIATRHINTEKNAGLMNKWWREILTQNNSLSEFIPELEISKCITVTKSQYDGFYNTDLESILKELKIKQVIITGVMTHLCCETTTRSAFIRGFQPFFAIDASATYNEKFHFSTLYNLSHGFAVPVLTNEILSRVNCQTVI